MMKKEMMIKMMNKCFRQKLRDIERGILYPCVFDLAVILKLSARIIL